MARINNLTVYNKDTNLTGEEYLIGSDTDDFGKTKNYQLKDIARYTFEDSDIEGIDQNNRVVLFDMGDMENYPNGVSEALNSLPEYRISDKEILIVDSFKSFYEPPTFAQHNNFYKNNPPLKIINYRHIFKLGKGYYGIPDENPTKLIHPEDLILLNSSEESLPSETGKKPILYTILNADGKTSHQAINEDSVFEIENGTDVYFNIHRKGLKMTYRFIGDPGTYGIGETQVEASDLLLMDKSELSLTAINDISVREIAPIFIPNSSTKADVVNAMPPINKSKGEITVFNFRQWKEEGVAARLELSSWLFKRNQGKYGNPDEGGVPVSNADFILISKIYSQSSGLSNSNYVNFDLSEEQNLVDAINNNEELIELSSDTTTLVERNKDVYELTGEDGLYGKGHLQISEGNLSLLEMDVPSSGEGPEVFDDDIIVALDSNETFGKYKNGDIIPAKDKTVAEVIMMSVQKALEPTVSLTSSTSIKFNQTAISNVLNFSYTINSLGASVASVKLEWRRNNTGSWILLTDDVNASSYTHSLTDTNFNSQPFNYRLTVTDTQGASKSVSLNLTPASYQAPTLTNFSVGSETRDRGNIATDITATVSRRSDLVNILGYRVQYRVNGGSWVNLTATDSPLSNTGGAVSETHNDSSLINSNSIEYRVRITDEYTTTTISGTKTINFLYRNLLGYSSKTSLNLTEILGLGNSTLSNSKSRTVNNVTAPANNYTYYVYWAGAGDLTGVIQDGAAPVLTAFTKLADVSGTNDFGAYVSYRVYKSNATQAFTNNNLQFS